jgi:nucleoside diphosphate kinase
MTEGPIVAMVLESENAIEKLRKVMGATDPAKAETEPFGSSSARTSSETLSTAPMVLKPLRSKSLSFSIT